MTSTGTSSSAGADARGRNRNTEGAQRAPRGVHGEGPDVHVIEYIRPRRRAALIGRQQAAAAIAAQDELMNEERVLL
jgi:hypothetical protein